MAIALTGDSYVSAIRGVSRYSLSLFGGLAVSG